MEFEDQDEQEEEEEEEEEEAMGVPAPGYDSTRVKMTASSPGAEQHRQQRPVSAVSRHHHQKPRYRECLKNHAVGIGGHALDGCGEFMAAGDEGSLDALKCAACNCHRNFHRKETPSNNNNSAAQPQDIFFPLPHHHLPHHHQVPQFAYYRGTGPGYPHVAASQQRAALALPSTSDQEDVSNQGGGSGGGTKKRFRTKFTQEQKDRMLGLAERLGWRIQKHDEDVVQQFCNETGVQRHVLKVWMHNNKHTLGKKP